jgi:hypothetical protein
MVRTEEDHFHEWGECYFQGALQFLETMDKFIKVPLIFIYYSHLLAVDCIRRYFENYVGAPERGIIW